MNYQTYEVARVPTDYGWNPVTTLTTRQPQPPGTAFMSAVHRTTLTIHMQWSLPVEVSGDEFLSGKRAAEREIAGVLHGDALRAAYQLERELQYGDKRRALAQTQELIKKLEEPFNEGP